MQFLYINNDRAWFLINIFLALGWCVGQNALENAKVSRRISFIVLETIIAA